MRGRAHRRRPPQRIITLPELEVDEGAQAEDEARMTFTEHLSELRTRIVRSGLSIVVLFVFTAYFSDKILWILAQPLLGNEEIQWTTLGPLEGFIVRFKIAAYAALAIAFPYILYQACAFIFPGLRTAEKKVVKYVIIGGGLLAMLGVVVAYFGVFPLVLPYLVQYTPEWATAQLRLQETIFLIILALLGFAAAFQFPLVVLILVYVGLLSPDTLRKYRRHAIVVLACLAAFFTPPDPFSMVIMLIPLVILYEASIWLSYVVARRGGQSPEGS